MDIIRNLCIHLRLHAPDAVTLAPRRIGYPHVHSRVKLGNATNEQITSSSTVVVRGGTPVRGCQVFSDCIGVVGGGRRGYKGI